MWAHLQIVGLRLKAEASLCCSTKLLSERRQCHVRRESLRPAHKEACLRDHPTTMASTFDGN